MSVVTPADPTSRNRLRMAGEWPTAVRHTEIATRWSRLDVAAASSRGDRRAVNEDSHSALAGAVPLFVVADGVGGGAMAAWASRQLVSRVHRALEGTAIDASAIGQVLLDADRDVGRDIANVSRNAGAATVALCAGRGALLSKWLIAWVGDCRIYRLGASAGQPAELLTRDDTYRQLNESPPAGGSPDDPARMVGNGAVTAPNVERIRLRAGEALVLCSDGVHKHVDANEMARVLHEEAPLARRCVRLLKLARTHGSHDDATVLVVRRDAEPPKRLLRRACALVALLSMIALAMYGFDVAPPAPSPAPQTHVQPEQSS